MPSHFDINHLNTLRTFAARVDYCNQNLKMLGKGSSRAAYALPNPVDGSQCVLKIAVNRKGIAQNAVESDAGWNKYPAVAKIYATSEKHEWVVMELCRRFNIFEFYNIMKLGSDFPIAPSEFLGVLVQRFLDRVEFKESDDIWTLKLEENIELFREEGTNDEFITFIDNLDTLIGDARPDEATIEDLRAMYNWGFATRDGNEQPVILDYGLNNKVWSSMYYKKPKNVR